MPTFHLKVIQIEQTCLFELTWKSSHRLNTKVIYPTTLADYYQDWRRNYLSFYRDQMRGSAGVSVSLLEIPKDWYGPLGLAEKQLRREFQYWLDSADLKPIRQVMVDAANQAGEALIFVSCDNLAIAKLPWEAWQLGTMANVNVQILRTSLNRTVTDAATQRRGKTRILAIIGDDTGLDFSKSKAALAELQKNLDVHFTGWIKDKSSEHLLNEIRAAIMDPLGWDILFFAGHSNELGGGQLNIAPNKSILIDDIADAIRVAKTHGLQFALFNSCEGIEIAESLLNLGLNGVSVMREAIRNDVAEDFFQYFAAAIADYQDVHSAVAFAGNALKAKHDEQYPSAYLIPSVYADPEILATQPETVPFRPRRHSWSDRLFAKLRPLTPSRREALILGALAIFSLLPSVQNTLLDLRQLTQAFYRESTGQFANSRLQVPIRLVAVDQESIAIASKRYGRPRPGQSIDRQHLANLIQIATSPGTRVIGIDYALMEPATGDKQLAQAIQQAKQQKIALIFAATHNDTDDNRRYDYASPDITGKDPLLGNMDFLFYLDSERQLPIFYPHLLGEMPGSPLPLAYQMACSKSHLQKTSCPPVRNFSVQPLTTWSAVLQQRWLHPIIDYSINPKHIYETISAKDFTPTALSNSATPSIVLITPKGENLGGVTPGSDIYTAPRTYQTFSHDERQRMSGGEVHAYITSQLLNRGFILPIPDLWMVGIVGLAGKGIQIAARQRSPTRWQKLILMGLPLIGISLSLQLYVSGKVLMPIVLPALAYFVNVAPLIRRPSRHV
jgi:hypothetical protein